jgi:hypothetical protein
MVWYVSVVDGLRYQEGWDGSYSDDSIQGPYSQHSIFCVTYKWVQKARVLHYPRVERLARDENPSLLGPFISYKENEVS